ncbi:MAG: aldehyde dehydrogenase family protein [Bacteroidales bacterium]|jgi:glyceraldehyde-3-phosphate dehydrogenase (NADP+)|nr:aldehyde dehydrogenase family protein [Bacteroidales bacterium]NLM93424.1 aldehyde dehydrogenase family protein [Bacteroidales bacterium]
MESFRIYAGGRFLTSSNELIVSCPFDGRPLAKTWLAGKQEYEQAVEAALQAVEPLRKMSDWERSKILLEVSQKIIRQEDVFASLIAREAAKPWRYALAEVRRAAQTFFVASEEARRLPGEYLSLDWTPEADGREGLVKYFPIGPVAGISPFNFPLNLASHKIAPAIAAACPIVLKPASSTPLATLALAEIIDESALPKGAFSVLPMDRQTGNMLVTDERFKLLSFTGSPAVGWKMKAGAGKKKVVLELGGNAGTIVAATAQIDHAVSRCLTGGFAYQGQVCIHAQRIFVHKSLFEAFSRKLVEAVGGLKYGDPLSPHTDITAMIDEDNARRVEQWIDEAVMTGAKVACGGHRKGAFVEPTVIMQAGPGMKVYDEEVFGPVVTLHPFDRFEEAVQMVNNSPYGLQAGVFTNDIQELDLAFNKLEVGGVIHNDTPIFRTDHMPYGGVKDSGLGREGVRYAMLDMLEPRILVRRRP